MTFHAEKCCHLVSAHAASCIQQRPLVPDWSILHSYFVRHRTCNYSAWIVIVIIRKSCKYSTWRADYTLMFKCFHRLKSIRRRSDAEIWISACTIVGIRRTRLMDSLLFHAHYHHRHPRLFQTRRSIMSPSRSDVNDRNCKLQRTRFSLQLPGVARRWWRNSIYAVVGLRYTDTGHPVLACSYLYHECLNSCCLSQGRCLNIGLNGIQGRQGTWLNEGFRIYDAR